MFLKVISWDIEVLPLREQMPTPDKCPILLVSTHFNFDFMVQDKKVRNIVLVLCKEDNEDGKIEFSGNDGNRLVFYLKDELVMLQKLFDLMKQCDVIIGYNICGFDFPYIAGSVHKFNQPHVKGRWSVLGGKEVVIGNSDKKVFCDPIVSKGMHTVKVGGLTGKIVFDVMYLLRREDESNIFKKEYNLKNVTLKHVSKEILGIEKLEFSPEEMIDYWNGVGGVGCDGVIDKKVREKFIDYCSRDSELALMFVTKFRLLDRFIMMSRRSGKLVQTVIDSLGSGILVENLLLQAYRKEDRVMACRKKEEIGISADLKKKKQKLIGAEVLIPKLGVMDNLASVDYKSLYPTVMITHNLCYSTVVVDVEIGRKLVEAEKAVEETDEIGNTYGIFVKKDVYIGIVPKLLIGLLSERALLKKELKKQEKNSPEYILYDAQQQAVKILLNSFYGYSGDSGAKLYNWIVATGVTANGRKVIKNTWNIIMDEIGTVEVNGKKFKLEVSAGDTDSSYIEVIRDGGGEVLRNEVITCVNNVIGYVNNIVEKPMELAFENYIKRIIVVAKKHYAMLVEDDSGKRNVISKGIESVRRDWCDFATENMSKMVDFILIENDLRDGVNKSIELVKSEAKRLKKGEVDSMLVLSSKLTKPITMYDNLEPHVQVAIKQKERGFPYQIGDRVQFYIIDNGKSLISEKAEEANYVLKHGLKIDYNYYLHHQFIPPVMRILELLDVKKEVLIVGLDEGQKNLKQWFF